MQLETYLQDVQRFATGTRQPLQFVSDKCLKTGMAFHVTYHARELPVRSARPIIELWLAAGQAGSSVLMNILRAPGDVCVQPTTSSSLPCW